MAQCPHVAFPRGVLRGKSPSLPLLRGHPSDGLRMPPYDLVSPQAPLKAPSSTSGHYGCQGFHTAMWGPQPGLQPPLTGKQLACLSGGPASLTAGALHAQPP